MTDAATELEAIRVQLAELAAIRPVRLCTKCFWEGFDAACPECGGDTYIKCTDPVKSIRETIVWLWEDLDNVSSVLEFERDRIITVVQDAVERAIRKAIPITDEKEDDDDTDE